MWILLRCELIWDIWDIWEFQLQSYQITKNTKVREPFFWLLKWTFTMHFSMWMTNFFHIFSCIECLCRTWNSYDFRILFFKKLIYPQNISRPGLRIWLLCLCSYQVTSFIKDSKDTLGSRNTSWSIFLKEEEIDVVWSRRRWAIWHVFIAW